MPVSFYLAFPSVPHFREVGYFCCTFPEVSLGGRYPLSCPSMPGLSSRQYLSATWRAAAPPACIIIAERGGFVKVGVPLSRGPALTAVVFYRTAVRGGVDALLESAEMSTLSLRPKAVTPPLWIRAPRGKKGS